MEINALHKQYKINKIETSCSTDSKVWVKFKRNHKSVGDIKLIIVSWCWLSTVKKTIWSVNNYHITNCYFEAIANKQ